MSVAVFALAPSEDLGSILQVSALGALLGAAVAAALKARDEDADPWLWPALGSVLFGIAGGLLVLVERLS